MLLSSGQFSFSLPLLSISSLGGLGWSFNLNYLSGNDVGDMVGQGFNFPQNLRIEQTAGNEVRIFTGSNTNETWVEQAGPIYVPTANNNSQAVLTRDGSGTSDEFTLSSSDDTVTKFYGFDVAVDTPGRVKSITDRYGNSQTYTWVNVSGVDQISSLTDSYGRTVTYRYYDGTGPEGRRLREIEDFLERKLNFQYDSLGHLIAVVTPSIDRGAEGNTFPGGTGYVFEYDTTATEPDRRDDLIKIWYPNQVAPYLDTATRTANVSDVTTNATPRYEVTYGQNPLDSNTWGRVLTETVGDAAASPAVGGTYEYEYTTSGLPTNIIDAGDPIVFRCTMTDRNGNEQIYDFNAADMTVRHEVARNRDKINIPSLVTYPGYVTWTKYNVNNQPLEIVHPAGNTDLFTYENGVVTGIGSYPRRLGLLLSQTSTPGNTIGITPVRSGSQGQTELTRQFFYDPLFNQQCAVIEERGNPIAASSTYFTPQNGGTTPTDADRSRYATINLFDYQKNKKLTVQNDTALQTSLGLTSTEIGLLIDHVDQQMNVPTDQGPLPDGFQMDLGDINGDGTGDGATSGLPTAPIAGNLVKIQHPSVRLIGSSAITTQVREEIFTVNARGMATTHTDPEGNLSVMMYYPYNDPEGDGQFIAPGLGSKQYGRLREMHVDANPDDVLSLVGTDGDLVDFISGKITRTNTPGEYQDLVTRSEGSKIGAGGGCAACAYDPLGNLLAATDPRGFTTRFDRNELGEVYRTVSPDPYRYQVETHYDANRNVLQVDTEDRWVEYHSDDPTSACYAQFSPTGSSGTAQVPTRSDGFGGEIRPGWFTNQTTYDLLDQAIEENVDATGSHPDRLVITMEYDANQNLIKLTQPEGNTVEYDYEERNLQIAQRVGNSPDTPAVTVTAFDANGNPLQTIGPAQRGAAGNHQTVTLEDAFDGGSQLVHTGDYLMENIYDGFDRVIQAIDAVGNVTDMNGTLGDPCLDPGGRAIKSTVQGPIGGATPTDRNGTGNKDLSVALSRFDEAGRQYEAQQNVFVAATTTLPSGNRTVTHIGGGLEANSVADTHTGTVEIINSGGQATSNESYVLSRTVHDRASRVVETLSDNTGLASAAFDGANRQIQETDPVGNVTDMQYDPNSNLTLTTATEKCTITSPTVPDEVFRTATRYDSLDRSVMQITQGADGVIDTGTGSCWDTSVPWWQWNQSLITVFGYDSRSNQTLVIDPKGNTTITIYDGANRPTQEQQHLREQGQGSNPPPSGDTLLPFGGATIVTMTAYDGNSRVTQLTDDRNDVTLFAYDTLNRQTVMTFHDSSTRTNVYNTASNVTTYTDENGSVFANTWDPLGRKTASAITLASGVLGTTAQSFEFDGLSRVTFARDTVIATHADVNLRYDSTGRVLEDSQTFGGNTRNCTYTKFTSYPVTQETFPDGRNITNVYDDLYRRTLIEETTGGADISAWEFFGPSRAVEVTLANGLICSHMNNARTRSARQQGQLSPAWGDDSSDRLGFDGTQRPITKRYLSGGINGTTHAYNDSTSVVGFTTAYDHSSNKFYDRHLHAESRSSLYEPYGEGSPDGGYDSIDRLRQYQRGVLSSTGGLGDQGGGSITTPISLPGTDQSRTYDLDGLGNWKDTAFDPVGGSLTTEVRQHNGLNEITRTDDGTTQTDFTYDGSTGASNGNLANDGTRKYEWDAFNRLKQVSKTPATPVLIGEYTYDALNRRIRKVVSYGGLAGTIPNGTTDFIYNNDWQCVEERDGANSVSKQYIWGTYIDELLQMKTAVTINGNVAGDYYPLCDLLYRTMALTNSSGTIVEAYDTDAYGNTLIFTAAGTGGDWWADDAVVGDNPTCEFIFTGRRYDSETEAYYYRRRFYVPSLGRFLSRDPMGYNDGLNVYQYVLSRPEALTDPYGEEPLPPWMDPAAWELFPETWIPIPLPPIDEAPTLPPSSEEIDEILYPWKEDCPIEGLFPKKEKWKWQDEVPPQARRIIEACGKTGFFTPVDIRKACPWAPVPNGSTIEWRAAPSGRIIPMILDPAGAPWKFDLIFEF